MKPGPKPTHPIPRILANLNIADIRPEYCWIWKSFGSPFVYPRVCWNRKDIAAHIVVCSEIQGVTTQGFEVDHLCRNRRCVRPSHLEVVTKQVNNYRSNSGSACNVRKTHCKNGHLLITKNIYESPYISKQGKRICKICNRAWKREKYKLTHCTSAAPHVEAVPTAWTSSPTQYDSLPGVP